MSEFQRSDRRVVMLLCIVVVCCVCVMILRDALKRSDNDKEAGEYVEAIMNSDTTKVVLGKFDPNDVDSVTLLQYGLGPVQIHSLLSYRRHNGRFDAPLAVSKLYNWSDEDVDKILPYIVIDKKYKKTYHYREQYEKEREEEYLRSHIYKERYDRNYDNIPRGTDSESATGEKYERKYDRHNKFTSLTKVDINTADTTLLCRIPGVGSGIANSIVRLRNRLGGYYSVDQLSDIKYISPELYEWFVVGSTPDLHLININKASFQVLNAHPYISYDQTRDLMNYRRMYGNIVDKEALLATHIFTKEEVEQLAPYLEY